jgi:hypothetical protein
MASVRVVALERGHCGRAVREQGEEFDVDESRLKDGSRWFTPVDKAPKPKKAEPNARPPGAGPSKGSGPPDISPGDVA